MTDKPDWDWAEEFANNMAIISRQRGNSEVGGSEIAAALRAAETRGIAKGLRQATQRISNENWCCSCTAISAEIAAIRAAANNLEHPNTEGKGNE